MIAAMQMFGADPVRFTRAWRGLPIYLRNRREFVRRAANSDGAFPIDGAHPCLEDRYAQGGVASGDYFHMDLLMAQSIFASGVKRHVDVGSRIDGFVAHVASFAHVEVLDIRPLRTTAANISFRQANLFELGQEFEGYTDSLSCLHVMEHLGLGRYGDPIDPDGHVKGWRALQRMVRPGGRFYFATPIGQRQRIEFDAHRVFGVSFLLDLMKTSFRIDRFSTVDDQGDLHVGQDPRSEAARNSFGYRCGCAIFELTKVSS
jgi:hypothetical protein